VRAYKPDNSGAPFSLTSTNFVENYVMLWRFQEFNLDEVNEAINGARTERTFTDSNNDTTTTRYYRIVRSSLTNFTFYWKTNAGDPWALITQNQPTNQLLALSQLSGPLQVGIAQGAFSTATRDAVFTDFELTGTNVTFPPPPATAPSGLVCTATNTGGSLTFSWTVGDPVNDRSLVIVRANGNIQASPIKGIVYNATNSYGASNAAVAVAREFVVFNGPGNSVTVTNLAGNNTLYTVAVYEYSNAAAPAYNTASPATNTFPGPQTCTNSWTIGASGKWEAGTNWILGVAPDSSQCIIYITNAGSDLVLSGLPAKRVLIDATTSTYVSSMTVQELVLSGAGPSVVNWLSLTNADTNVPLHVLNQVSMAAGSQLTVDNSSLQVDGVLGVGAQPAPGFTNNFPATFSINSGSALVGTLVVGPVASNGLGTLNVSGGALLVNNLGIGNNGATNLGSGTGTATVGNGATLSVSSLSLGSTAGGLGSLVMSNGSSLLVGSNLNLVSGSLSSTSSVSITGGSLLASNGLVQIGPAGSGQLLISGGIHTLRQVRLGSGDTNGSGFLHLSGGLLTVLGTGTGPGAGLDANLIVIDGGDLNGSGTSLTVGDAHSAEVDVSGDGAAQFATVYVGYSPNYTGTYAQSGGSMAVSSTLVVGDCTSGAIGNATLTGGILFVTNATHTAVLDVRYGTFALNPGSTLVVDNLLTNSSCGNFVNNGGTLLPWSGVPGLGTLHTTNLLLNPGAETGNFSYWTLGGDTPYLVVDTGYNYSGIPPHSGTYEFAGGGDNESLSQAVALVGNQGITAAAIDTGKLLASISFWEQGAGFYAPGFNDDADVKIEFLDGNFNTLTARTTPQIDSGVSFVWSNYTAQYVIPIGTRSIRYTMEFILKEALHEFNYDVCVDDNSLIISSPPSLNLVVAGPNVVLTWPAWGTNYLLQSTISLSLPNSWQTVTTVPVATQNGLVVTDPLHGPARFYRLSTPVVP
jgi:hypothetical protein